MPRHTLITSDVVETLHALRSDGAASRFAGLVLAAAQPVG